MARRFTRTASDVLHLAPGNLAALDGGPITVGWIWRPASVHAGGLIRATNAAATQVVAINPFSDGRIYYSATGFRATETYTAGDGWRLVAITKPDGTAQARGHSYDYDTGLWAHTDWGTLGDSTGGPIAAVKIGHQVGAEYLDADLAVMGVWGAALADAVLEGLTADLDAWLAAGPAALWPFNQSTVSDPVLDVTGGGADQTGISGTTVSADPPGFSYTTSPAPADVPPARGIVAANATSTIHIAGQPAARAVNRSGVRIR